MTQEKANHLTALAKLLDWPAVKWPLPPMLRKRVDAALREAGVSVDWRKLHQNPNSVLRLALTMAALQITRPELFPKD